MQRGLPNAYKTSDILIQKIIDYYLKSNDYNGISDSMLTDLPLDNNKIKQELTALVLDGQVGVISSSFDTNPYINRFGFPDINVQLEELQNAFVDCIIYPTPKMISSKITLDYTKPMEQYLLLGHPQLIALFFEYDVLLTYALEPRFHFEFNDYSGSIQSSDKVDERRYIELKTFGIGRDEDKLVIVAFPRYLRNMSPANQILWESHRIQDVSHCRVLKSYLDNEIYGSWNSPNTVYHSILSEIENINVLSERIFGIKFFRVPFKKKELACFDMLPFPSQQLYDEFLLLLEKVTVSNINDKFFNRLISDVLFEDGRRKGSLYCLGEWLDRVSPQGKDRICNPLKKVREERQPPAHKVQSNSYAPELLNKQHDMCTLPIKLRIFAVLI